MVDVPTTVNGGRCTNPKFQGGACGSYCRCRVLVVLKIEHELLVESLHAILSRRRNSEMEALQNGESSTSATCFTYRCEYSS